MLLDAIFVVVILVLIGYVVHLRATNNATSVTVSSLVGVPSTIASEMELLTGNLRAKIDSKFEALGKWLLAELQNTTGTTPPIDPPTPPTDPTVPPVVSPVEPQPTPVEPQPVPVLKDAVVVDDQHLLRLRILEEGNIVEQIDAAIAALVEKKNKIDAAEKAVAEARTASDAAQKATAAAEAALREVINS